jgi:hypothetical protein
MIGNLAYRTWSLRSKLQIMRFFLRMIGHEDGIIALGE